MTITLNEQKFADMFSFDAYFEIVNIVFNQIKESEKFKNKEKHIVSYSVFPVTKAGKKWKVSVEAVATQEKGHVDLRIAGIKVSDEEMPDEMLDRYNQLIKEFP